MDGGPPVSAGRVFQGDVAGAALPPELVMSARAEEIKFTQSWNVWGVECRARAGKGPIGGRWVGHTKGGSDAPNVRSRCVAKDIAFCVGDSLFTAIPPPWSFEISALRSRD
eukprot:15473457-Alexandrium_andersonii.AAC.1